MADETPTATDRETDPELTPEQRRAGLIDRLRTTAPPIPLMLEHPPLPDRVVAAGRALHHERIWYCSRGPAVERLQRLLAALGVYPIDTADADDLGLFGNTTDTAVRGFQRMVGLPDDGIVNAATWTAVEHAAGVA